MALQIIPAGTTLPDMRGIINANTNDIEERFISLEQNTLIRSGDGPPSNNQYNNNDLYIDTDAWNLYLKVAGAWVFQQNIVGPAGIPGLNARGAYSSSTTYNLNDAVVYRNNYWRAKRTVVNVEPTTSNTADWEKVSGGFYPAGTWASGQAYRVDDVVLYNGARYRVKTNFTSTSTIPPNDSTNYEVYVAKGDPGLNAVPRGTWNNVTAYVANDLVNYNGNLWRALQGNTNTIPTEGATWTLFLTGGGTGTSGLPSGGDAGAKLVKNSSADGDVVWQLDDTGQACYFLIGKSVDQTVLRGATSSLITWQTWQEQKNCVFNLASDNFTIPDDYPGLWEFIISLEIYQAVAGATIPIKVYVNGSFKKIQYNAVPYTSRRHTCTYQGVVRVSAGDVVHFTVGYENASTTNNLIIDDWSQATYCFGRWVDH